MRRLILGLLAAASVLLSAPAQQADAQYFPGYPPMPGYGPVMTSAATADPSVSCNQAVAQAAYPIGNQMIYLTAAANAYPMTPTGRPVIAPPFAYPGFAGIYFPGAGSLPVANTLFANGLTGLNAFPAGASPAAIVNALAGVPGGLVPVGGLGTPITADLLGIAALQQGQVANLLAAIDSRQAVLGTRLNAAALNASFTAFPREQAALLKEVLEGLTFYRDLVCNQGSGSAAGGGNGSSSAAAPAGDSGSGQRQ